MQVYYKVNKVPSMLMHIRPDLPLGVCFDSGELVMVQINYFVYHAPWWLGDWSVTNGEHDVFNSLYAGNSAQRYYNHVTSMTTDSGILFSIAALVLSVSISVSPAIFGLSALGWAIVASALTAAGVAVGALTAVRDNDFTSLYESTYGNEHSGNKYIWMFDSVNYYYPSVTVVGSLASSIGMYGYLSNMNIITVIPNVPVTPYGAISGVALVASISGSAHGIAKSMGWNNWGYEGAYS